MSNLPKVSVVIPTHNRPELIQRAIASVLAQTAQDFEIIVVDDGMIHSATEIVSSFNDERIRYIQNEIPLGGGGSRNKGINEARGEYIAFLDDDDEWRSDKLELQISALDRADRKIVICFSGIEMVDGSGKVIRTILPREEGPIIPFERLLYRPYIWTSSIMIRTSCCREEGYIFDERLPKNQEWDLTLRISESHQFFAINETLTRIHVLGDDAHMGGKGNILNIIKGNEIFLEKHRALYERYPRSYAAQLFRLGGFNYEAGNFNEVKKLIFKSWKLQPFNMIYCTHLCASLFGESFYSSLKNLGK